MSKSVLMCNEQQTGADVQTATESQQQTAQSTANADAYDDYLYYSEETEKIMTLATTVQTKAETQRRGQVNALDERRARHQTEEQIANAVLHVADKANKRKQQERERQTKLVKDRVTQQNRRPAQRSTDNTHHQQQQQQQHHQQKRDGANR